MKQSYDLKLSPPRRFLGRTTEKRVTFGANSILHTPPSAKTASSVNVTPEVPFYDAFNFAPFGTPEIPQTYNMSPGAERDREKKERDGGAPNRRLFTDGDTELDVVPRVQSRLDKIEEHDDYTTGSQGSLDTVRLEQMASSWEDSSKHMSLSFTRVYPMETYNYTEYDRKSQYPGVKSNPSPGRLLSEIDGGDCFGDMTEDEDARHIRMRFISVEARLSREASRCTSCLRYITEGICEGHDYRIRPYFALRESARSTAPGPGKRMFMVPPRGGQHHSSIPANPRLVYRPQTYTVY